MLRRYEDKANRRRRSASIRHAPHVRHGVNFVEICDGAPGTLCVYRQATAEERERFRHVRIEVK